MHQALYLLFNEGYHGASPATAVRSELCREAMWLTALLLEHPLGRTPTTYALASLMCLNAAWLPARVDAAGTLRALVDQDRSLWGQELLAEGLKFLDLSATGAPSDGVSSRSGDRLSSCDRSECGKHRLE